MSYRVEQVASTFLALAGRPLSLAAVTTLCYMAQARYFAAVNTELHYGVFTKGAEGPTLEMEGSLQAGVAIPLTNHKAWIIIHELILELAKFGYEDMHGCVCRPGGAWDSSASLISIHAMAADAALQAENWRTC